MLARLANWLCKHCTPDGEDEGDGAGSEKKEKVQTTFSQHRRHHRSIDDLMPPLMRLLIDLRLRLRGGRGLNHR